MKIKLAAPFEEIHGSLGDTVFKRLPGGQIIISKKPDMSGVKWSQAQVDNRVHMGDAVAATQKALTDPKVRARYERKAKKLGRRAWNVALSDCLLGKDWFAKR